ncbi:hypothetical protein JAAARDRAFT_50523 [Jaapia argillacea MUCL 33604]|uniref:Uncharacterized protein n=1 Tax=Jaapia argillacea MUCL 33604 TaxID=933084 RepID=A0A067PNH9_9AGAM|nr:hypothetical protein JAAARDRAFT_50523 [Jaapia argillacea MUCL 33604]
MLDQIVQEFLAICSDVAELQGGEGKFAQEKVAMMNENQKLGEAVEDKERQISELQEMYKRDHNTLCSTLDYLAAKVIIERVQFTDSKEYKGDDGGRDVKALGGLSMVTSPSIFPSPIDGEVYWNIWMHCNLSSIESPAGATHRTRTSQSPHLKTCCHQEKIVNAPQFSLDVNTFWAFQLR